MASFHPPTPLQGDFVTFSGLRSPQAGNALGLEAMPVRLRTPQRPGGWGHPPFIPNLVANLVESPIADESDESRDEERVNVDFPVWMVHSLDKEAKRLGVPRQSLIKVWVADRLENAKICCFFRQVI